MKIFLKQKVIIGFLCALVVLFLISISSYLQTKKFIAASQQRESIYKFLAELDNLLFHLDEIQTNMRGYVITGEEAYLPACNKSIKLVLQDREEMNSLAITHPEQHGKIKLLIPLISLHVDFSREVISLRREQGFKPAEDLIRTGKGEENMNNIRSIYYKTKADNMVVLEHLEHSLEIGETRTINIIIIGSLFATAIVAFSIYSINRELNERIRAEARLAESEARFRRLSNEFNALLDAIPDILTLQDHELKILWANHAAISSVKHGSGIIGEHCYDLWHNRTTPCGPCPAERSFSTGTLEKGEISSPDSKVWDLRAVPVKDEKGIITGVMELARDITDNRRLEAQLAHAQKMEAVGTLAGGIAHDFNNILTAIVGYAHLTLIKMREDDLLKTNIQQILDASQRAAVLTRSLLTFSKKQPVNMTLVNLNKLVEDFGKFLLRLLREDISLKISCADQPLPVTADSGMMEQVLMNLVTNARDAMPDGGKVTIETRRFVFDENFNKVHGFGEPGNYAFLSVSDNGTGMDKTTREKIFEPFFTTKEFGKGTGLGLAIVYGIIKSHGGHINVYSELGYGTTFNIYLPISESLAFQERNKETESVHLKGGTETVLVAEDDPALRKLSITVLSHYGYNVIEAEDGEEAIHKFIENKDNIRIIILDGIMPKKNGKEAYEEIRRIKSDIKVIFMSGYSEDIFSSKELTEQGIVFMLKPLTPADLLKNVREVLDKNRTC